MALCIVTFNTNYKQVGCEAQLRLCKPQSVRSAHLLTRAHLEMRTQNGSDNGVFWHPSGVRVQLPRLQGFRFAQPGYVFGTLHHVAVGALSFG